MILNGSGLMKCKPYFCEIQTLSPSNEMTNNIVQSGIKTFPNKIAEQFTLILRDVRLGRILKVVRFGRNLVGM